MSISDKEHNRGKFDVDRNLILPVFAGPESVRRDFDDFARLYRKSMKKISKLIKRGSLARADEDNDPNVSLLFLKGALMQLTYSAISELGEKKARSILRQIYEETRS